MNTEHGLPLDKEGFIDLDLFDITAGPETAALEDLFASEFRHDVVGFLSAVEEVWRIDLDTDGLLDEVDLIGVGGFGEEGPDERDGDGAPSIMFDLGDVDLVSHTGVEMFELDEDDSLLDVDLHDGVDDSDGER